MFGDSDREILKTIALYSIPLLLGIIGYFIRTGSQKVVGLVGKLQDTITEMDKDFVIVKKDIEILTDHIESVKHIKEEWFAVKQNMGEVILEIKSLKSSLEDVVILKRDTQTMWKRLDELRDEIREERKS